MEATTIETAKSQQAYTVLQRSVCLLLQCGYIGNHRKVDMRNLRLEKDGVDLEKEKRRTSMTKQLVASAHLRPCAATIDAAKAFLRSVSTPGHRIFGSGTYLVSNQAVLEVEARLTQYQEDLEAHALALAAKWSDVVEESKIALGRLADAQEFPTAQDVLDEYRLDWSYVSFAAPDQLIEVDQAVFEAHQAKQQARLEAASHEIVSNLQESALKVFKELATRLKPGADGKVKALHPSALDGIQELLSRLPILNITEDEALADIVVSCGAIAEGITVDTLKQSKGIRAMLLERAESAVEQLDAIITSGRRAITLE